LFVAGHDDEGCACKVSDLRFCIFHGSSPS
jgi:hypothetical protein